MREQASESPDVRVELTREEAYELLLRSMQSYQEDSKVFACALRKLANAIEGRGELRKAA